MILSDSVLLQLTNYCFLVNTGKPSSLMPLQVKYRDDAIEFIKNYNLNYYIEELADGWLTLWIYKLPYILEIIKMAPNEPQNIFDHWMLGKLFGYSDYEIGEFIKNTLSPNEEK
jgi:hypothetical protein